MRLLSLFVAASLVSVQPFAATAGGRGELAALSRAFDESALRNDDDDNAKPASVRKWTGPIRLAFSNASRAPGLVETTRKALALVAAETTTITVADVAADDSSANFIVSFDENESVSGKRNCFARTKPAAASQPDPRRTDANGSRRHRDRMHRSQEAVDLGAPPLLG